LRPAAVLAKMLATLDTLAPGRLADRHRHRLATRGVSDAVGPDFDKAVDHARRRRARDEVLWREAPGELRSSTVNFDRVYSTPFPRDGASRCGTAWKPTPRQAQRIAELGAG
jgi:hypothetical protein